MKMKKVLAAVLAGTMVMAGTMTAFASETLTSAEWWSGTGNSTETSISGDGTWSYTITCDAVTEDGYGAFSVELFDASGSYVTTGSDINIWIAGNGTGDVSGAAETLGYDLTAGTEYIVVVTRSGSDFTIKYYDNGTKFAQLTATGTNLEDDVTLHFMAQLGTFTIDLSEGDATSSSSSGSEDGSSEDGSSEDGSSEDGSSEDSSSEDSSSTDKSTQSGDAAPIAATVVALLGCAAIVVASKKKMA